MHRPTFQRLKFYILSYEANHCDLHSIALYIPIVALWGHLIELITNYFELLASVELNEAFWHWSKYHEWNNTSRHTTKTQWKRTCISVVSQWYIKGSAYMGPYDRTHIWHVSANKWSVEIYVYVFNHFGSAV